MMGILIVCMWYISRYQKSIEIYEEIARQSLNNNLLKYGVKGHLLNAGICQLCKGDVVAITNALERYQVWIWFYLSISAFYPMGHLTIKMLLFTLAGIGSNFFWNTWIQIISGGLLTVTILSLHYILHLSCLDVGKISSIWYLLLGWPTFRWLMSPFILLVYVLFCCHNHFAF